MNSLNQPPKKIGVQAALAIALTTMITNPVLAQTVSERPKILKAEQGETMEIVKRIFEVLVEEVEKITGKEFGKSIGPKLFIAIFGMLSSFLFGMFVKSYEYRKNKDNKTDKQITLSLSQLFDFQGNDLISQTTFGFESLAEFFGETGADFIKEERSKLSNYNSVEFGTNRKYQALQILPGDKTLRAAVGNVISANLLAPIIALASIYPSNHERVPINYYTVIADEKPIEKEVNANRDVRVITCREEAITEVGSTINKILKNPSNYPTLREFSDTGNMESLRKTLYEEMNLSTLPGRKIDENRVNLILEMIMYYGDQETRRKWCEEGEQNEFFKAYRQNRRESGLGDILVTINLVMVPREVLGLNSEQIRDRFMADTVRAVSGSSEDDSESEKVAGDIRKMIAFLRTNLEIIEKTK